MIGVERRPGVCSPFDCFKALYEKGFAKQHMCLNILLRIFDGEQFFQDTLDPECFIIHTSEVATPR